MRWRRPRWRRAHYSSLICVINLRVCAHLIVEPSWSVSLVPRAHFLLTRGSAHIPARIQPPECDPSSFPRMHHAFSPGARPDWFSSSAPRNYDVAPRRLFDRLGSRARRLLFGPWGRRLHPRLLDQLRLLGQGHLSLRHLSRLVKARLCDPRGVTPLRLEPHPKGLRPRPQEGEKGGADMKEKGEDGEDKQVGPPGEVGVEVVAQIVVVLGADGRVVELVL
mmetsp:Transcript_19944/g.64754  ORF Transcript_19944/g.64754 Transcript_19944/m.64754 type:complete len:221 (-) Transcript_19944:2386-3048(-)|eukprot:scaffold4184_cov120-Isochrysis_galbana.AAC.12